MPYKDPEKAKEYKKQYRENNKQKITEQNKEYYQTNKEKIKECKKEYYTNNKQKLDEQNKEYYQTPNGKKSNTIGRWKRCGLIHDNYNEIYDLYLNTNKCNVCNYVFDKSNCRCMDHCHTTGLFRQILCNKCNTHDNWKKLV